MRTFEERLKIIQKNMENPHEQSSIEASAIYAIISMLDEHAREIEKLNS